MNELSFAAQQIQLFTKNIAYIHIHTYTYVWQNSVAHTHRHGTACMAWQSLFAKPQVFMNTVVVVAHSWSDIKSKVPVLQGAFMMNADTHLNVCKNKNINFDEGRRRR